MDFVGIDGEMHERPGRVGEKWVFGIAVGPVLLDGVPVASVQLVGILEFSCDHWDTVDEERKVDGLGVPSGGEQLEPAEQPRVCWLRRAERGRDRSSQRA